MLYETKRFGFIIIVDVVTRIEEMPSWAVGDDLYFAEDAAAAWTDEVDAFFFSNMSATSRDIS